MTTDYLKIIFFKRLSQYTNDTELVKKTFEALLKQYTSSKRHYHNISHIVGLLNMLETHKYHIADDEVMFFSIWFHDSIYNTWKSDNEEKSAIWAKEVLSQTNFPAERIEKVCAYILATKTHTPTGDSDLNWFLDFDLSILGSLSSVYELYVRQIREEYTLIPNFIFNKGRKKVLRSLLEKERLYQTEDFRTRLEAQARMNIEAELQEIE